VVDALFAASGEAAAPVLEGLAAAAEKYGVPLAGGHTNSRAPSPGLSAAILGRAKTLLTSFDARPGEVIIAAIDLRGRMRDPALYWDASTAAGGDRLRGDLELLPQIAEAGLCRAAKDISMAGTIGTALMLLEASRLGGVIDIGQIPRPEHVAIENWLMAFPSFGFLLSVPAENAKEVIGAFAARGIAAAAIGTTDSSRAVRLRDGAAEAPLWDFARDDLIGCAVAETFAHA